MQAGSCRPEEVDMNTWTILAVIFLLIGTAVTASGLLAMEKQLSGRDIINPKVRVRGRLGGRITHVLLAAATILMGAACATTCIWLLCQDRFWVSLYLFVTLTALLLLWGSTLQVGQRIYRQTHGQEGIALDDFLMEKNGVARGSVQIGKKRYLACILYHPAVPGEPIPPREVKKTVLRRGSTVRDFTQKGVILYLPGNGTEQK